MFILVLNSKFIIPSPKSLITESEFSQTIELFSKLLRIIKESEIYNKNHLIIIHRKEKSKDDLGKIVNVLLTRNYGRSKVIFGRFNLNIS